LRDTRWRLRWNDFTRCESRQVVQNIPPIRSQWESAFAELFIDGNKYTGSTTPNHFTSQIPDHPDREFAALADATGAVLVTNDDDFLHVKEQLSVYVVTPGTFCNEFACPPD
jgi:predicted nucleic acid-binding protein